MKKQDFKKLRRLSNLQDNFKCSNIRIIGLPEKKEEEQEIENLLEKLMKENFPNLEKEIDFQEVQETQRLPKKLDPRKHTPRHIIHYPRFKIRREFESQQEKRKQLPTKVFP